eukprot:scaffold4510_cov183-Amphora_coffeaeformis.AAC.92
MSLGRRRRRLSSRRPICECVESRRRDPSSPQFRIGLPSDGDDFHPIATRRIGQGRWQLGGSTRQGCQYIFFLLFFASRQVIPHRGRVGSQGLEAAQPFVFGLESLVPRLPIFDLHLTLLQGTTTFLIVLPTTRI